MNKQRLVALLGARPDFTVVLQTREDYVAFLWCHNATARAVLVEEFPSEFPGEQSPHDEIHQKKDQLRLEYVGLAVKRYPELSFLFSAWVLIYNQPCPWSLM